MRRVVVLVVVALVAAGFAGALLPSGGVRVNAETISSSRIRSELNVISTHRAYFCYLKIQFGLTSRANGRAVDAQWVAQYTRTRVDSLAIEQYVTQHFHWSPSTTDLSSARAQYADELTQGATSTGGHCNKSAAQALASLPANLLEDQLRANVYSVELLARLKGTIALTESSLRNFFQQHVHDYDTLCVTLAYVPYSQISAFGNDQKRGLSLSQLARKYSVDSSASKGGVLGCFRPTDTQNFGVVRSYTAGLPLNTYPTQPRIQQYQQSYYAIYLAVTKRTTNSFTIALASVVADARSNNAGIASAAESRLLTRASIVIDPAFGTWLRATSTVNAPSTPLTSLTPNSGRGLSV